MNEIRFTNRENVKKFKELGINQVLIDEFKKNEEKIMTLESINSYKSNFPNNKIIDNIEIVEECIEKGLVITPLNKCKFVIPLEAVDRIIEFKSNIKDNIIYKKSENFLILYPSKYYKLKNKEIPIEEIGVYYSPYFSFTLRNFSIELLEMKKKPKKASIIKQAATLLRISRSNTDSFDKEIGPLAGCLIIFGLISALIFLGSKSIIASLVMLPLFLLISISTFYKSVIEPLDNKDKIIEEAKDIDLI